ncbi:XdhC family protein [Pseudoxanthomonas sp. PXM03]|uniref:XdhC family protein n=1 Tax=Pseudoxanthomonas sp. PXM03 TaxID=2769284 RepID=UPI0031BB403D
MLPNAHTDEPSPRGAIPASWQDVLTDDALEILQYAADAVAAGVSAALVTLVEVRGGAARQPGAQMVVLADGRYCGFVSGGCVEAAAAHEASEAIASGRDRVVRFGEGSDYFDIVLPCGGGITLAIHVIRSGAPLQHTLERLYRRQSAGLAYDQSHSSIACIPCPAFIGWAGDQFHLAFVPRPRLVIFGGSIEASSAASLAHAAGYEVALASHAGPMPKIDEFTAIALLFHDLDREMRPLQAALDAAPFYIGALGSTRTHERRAHALLGLGYRAEDVARVKAPIGIFPKARDASSLALSVLADIALAWQARVRGGVGGELREDHVLVTAQPGVVANRHTNMEA